MTSQAKIEERCYRLAHGSVEVELLRLAKESNRIGLHPMNSDSAYSYGMYKGAKVVSHVLHELWRKAQSEMEALRNE